VSPYLYVGICVFLCFEYRTVSQPAKFISLTGNSVDRWQREVDVFRCVGEVCTCFSDELTGSASKRKGRSIRIFVFTNCLSFRKKQ
jgi:hypothetical protein